MARMLLAQLGAAPVMMSLLYGVSAFRFRHADDTGLVDDCCRYVSSFFVERSQLDAGCLTATSYARTCRDTVRGTGTWYGSITCTLA